MAGILHSSQIQANCIKKWIYIAGLWGEGTPGNVKEKSRSKRAASIGYMGCLFSCFRTRPFSTRKAQKNSVNLLLNRVCDGGLVCHRPGRKLSLSVMAGSSFALSQRFISIVAVSSWTGTLLAWHGLSLSLVMPGPFSSGCSQEKKQLTAGALHSTAHPKAAAAKNPSPQLSCFTQAQKCLAGHWQWLTCCWWWFQRARRSTEVLGQELGHDFQF